MKKVMIYVVISLVGLFGLVFTIGLSMPKEKIYTKERTISAPVSKVFNIVADFENQKEWRNDVKEIKVLSSNSWTEVPEKGTPITFKVTDKEQDRFFRIEIIEPQSFSGYWTGEFEKIAESKTKVTFKEVVVISNPLFRVISSLLVDLDATMEVYMNNLVKAVE